MIIANGSRRAPARRDWPGDGRGRVLIQPQAKFIYFSLLLTEKTALPPGGVHSHGLCPTTCLPGLHFMAEKCLKCSHWILVNKGNPTLTTPGTDWGRIGEFCL